LNDSERYGYLWILSELLYYIGLVLAAAAIPSLAIVLWIMSLLDKVVPNYWYILLAWFVSLMMFISGIWLKNRIWKD
jgi:ABC-type bacteriocin/lantibiotic exporter with double-glycine peptidase domain